MVEKQQAQALGTDHSVHITQPLELEKNLLSQKTMNSKRVNININEAALRHALEAIRKDIRATKDLERQSRYPTPAMQATLRSIKSLDQWCEAEIELALIEGTQDEI